MDAEKNEWLNPYETLFFLRCTSVKYAKEFIERGSIKFGVPRTWEEIAFSSRIIGRGDPYEGTIAFSHIYDVDNLKALNDKYPDAERKLYKKRTLFKRTRSMNLPCFCLYGLNIAQFSIPRKEGWQKVEAEIPASYFSDFVDHKTIEEISMLPDDDKPAIIVIKNTGEFRNRIEDYLVSIGCDENEIMFEFVKYMDFDKYGEEGWYDFSQTEPNELFLKSDLFSIQKEVRVVVNTDKEDVLELLKSPLEIGSMNDIAIVVERFFEDGLKVEAEVNAYIQE